MSASFHPIDDVLLAYAAGSLDQAMALLVASHLTLCPRCRDEVARAEAVGGALLDDLPPSDTALDLLDVVLARLDEPAPAVPVKLLPPLPGSILPQPLRQSLGGDLDRVRWKRLGQGLEQALVLQSGPSRARLYRIAPGLRIPEHGHDGNELTLVLQGGFSDLNGHYLAGDIACADDGVVHRPTADRDGYCLCLAVTDAPLRLTGLLGRLVSPFLNL